MCQTTALVISHKPKIVIIDIYGTYRKKLFVVHLKHKHQTNTNELDWIFSEAFIIYVSEASNVVLNLDYAISNSYYIKNNMKIFLYIKYSGQIK